MLSIVMPPYCTQETRWVIQVLFGEFLGLQYTLCPSSTPGFSIRMDSKQLDLPDSFFAGAATAWLKPESLAIQPLAQWDLASSGLMAALVTKPVPVLFGLPGGVVSQDLVQLNTDILGGAFYLLSRYEEAVLPDRDPHDRFPATASLAYQAGFLERPLVDEYVEVLWATLKYLWPGLQRRSRQPRTFVSCDVDWPYSPSIKSVSRTIREVGSDLIRHRSPRMAAGSAINPLASRFGNYRFDRNNTFEWMMEVNERAGHSVAFYFLADHRHRFDGFYSLAEPRIRTLMRRIHQRGHEIGMHGSYTSYLDPAQTQKEATRLHQAMQDQGIAQTELGNRQHYLRWSTLKTPRILSDAGYSYDTTLSFADMLGFRCGTCHEYSMYDLAARQPLRLKQRPLVLMDRTALDHSYMGLGYTSESLARMESFKQICYRYRGNFTLLWHNSYFLYPQDRQFYEYLVAKQESV